MEKRIESLELQVKFLKQVIVDIACQTIDDKKIIALMKSIEVDNG